MFSFRYPDYLAFYSQVKGFAWGGGGAGINRVDVSLNGGKTFTRADLMESPVKQRRKSEWGWVFLERDVPVPEDMQKRLAKGEKVPMAASLASFASLGLLMYPCSEFPLAGLSACVL